MNTRTRRLVLRLIVGLLTFLIGVMTAIVLGNFNPLAGRRARVRRCAEYARPAPSISVPVLLPDTHPVAWKRYAFPDFRPEIRLGKTQRHEWPQAAEPVVPSFEDEGQVKSPKAVAPSHSSH
jgi:hypothetical protein